MPGVSVRATVSYANTGLVSDAFGGGSYVGASSITPATYSLFANVATGATGATGQVAGQTGATFSRGLNAPSRATTIDSWAGVVE